MKLSTSFNCLLFFRTGEVVEIKDNPAHAKEGANLGWQVIASASAEL